MNYRHAFHAGNFADVMKHALLARLLTHLQRKDTPFFVLDTHGGVGLYDLDADEATYWATDDKAQQMTLELDLEGPVDINALEFREAKGFENRIQSYKVEAQVDSDWTLLSEGTTVGGSKIDRFPKVTAWKVRLIINKSNGFPAIRKFGLYRTKKGD